VDRSLAAGATAGRLGGFRRAGTGRPGPFARLRGALATPLAALRSRRRLRIALICALVALPLLGGAFMWLRQSSFVAVQHIHVSGAHGPQAKAIDGALREAARGMSTLAPDEAKLRAAVARFPQVSAVNAYPSFPHAMRIVVDERPPIAALLVGGTRIAISADGIALGASVPTASLPTVADNVAPPSGGRSLNPLVLQALTVLGAAPAAIDRLAEKAYFTSRGLTVAMRSGLLVYFGDASRPHAKWLALAAVLSDPSSAGAIYVDVRSPERAAAGFPAGAGPHESEAGAEATIGRGETTVGALAEKLTAATPEGRAQAAAAAEAEEGATEASAAGGEEGASEGEGASETEPEAGG
jgi:cell division septal protein FtsQ